MDSPGAPVGRNVFAMGFYGFLARPLPKSEFFFFFFSPVFFLLRESTLSFFFFGSQRFISGPLWWSPFEGGRLPFFRHSLRRQRRVFPPLFSSVLEVDGTLLAAILTSDLFPGRPTWIFTREYYPFRS